MEEQKKTDIKLILRWTMFALKILFVLYFVLCICLTVFSFSISIKCQNEAKPVSFMGMQLFVMGTNTMGDALPYYTLVVIKTKAFEELQVKDEEIGAEGDIIVFRYNKNSQVKAIAAHRVVRKDFGLFGTEDTPQVYYVTKGDLLEKEDKVRITEVDYFGIVGQSFKITAFFFNVVTNVSLLIFTLILPAIVLFVMQMTGIGDFAKNKFKEKDADE